jgi:crossover junction endodeoxyribonuclease RusA
MKTLKLTSPLPPSVNSYLNYKIASKGKKKFVQLYLSPETVVYKNFFSDYVMDQIREQNWTRPEKGKLVFVQCTFFLDRKRKDPNNFLKVPFDVLTEAGVYVDDDTALPLSPRLYIDAKNPRIEIEIYESNAIGIFDDEEDYELFLKNNCELCRKKTESCSILKKLLDNRLIEEVENRTCLRRK